MRNVVLGILFGVWHMGTYAQSHSPEQSIRSFFNAMNTRDTSALGSFFAPQVNMVTTYQNQNDSTIVVYDSVDEFVNSVGKKDDNTFEEIVSNFKVNVDAGLAQVWCDYQFILNGKLSHCGVDAFHLVKVGNEWKITHLADTRRRSPCETNGK